MSHVDVAMVSPYPSLASPATLPSGVAAYTERLAGALAHEGLQVRVLAPEVDGEPALARVGRVTVERSYRRGAAALPTAASAARRSAAPIVHLQYETFLFGGPTSVPGVAPALMGLRGGGQGPVVTMHQVVDPATMDREFTRLHRVRMPHQLARAGLSTLQRSVSALAAATVVHERAFTEIMPDAVVVPHGIDRADVLAVPDSLGAKVRLGLDPDRLVALCFGFLAPYKNLEAALEAAALAGDAVQLVVAGGSHPRLTGPDGYAEALRRRYGGCARFLGYVAEEDVATVFRAADVLLLPYATPFATSGPLALALGYGTPVLCSAALARCVGAPSILWAPVDPPGLSRRLLQLASDPRQLQQVDSATRDLAAGRSWGDVARRHIALYEEVIHARRPLGWRLRPGKSRG
jgi:glycosyltransferase involved in cell wall biosynthesis